jgi:hypothetical protein
VSRVKSGEHGLVTRIIGSFEHTRTMSVNRKFECSNSETRGLVWNVVVT